MREPGQQELEQLESEYASLFDQSGPPEDPWRLARMEARAAEIPGRHTSVRSMRWALAASVGLLAVVSMALVLLIPQRHDPTSTIPGTAEALETPIACAPDSGGSEISQQDAVSSRLAGTSKPDSLSAALPACPNPGLASQGDESGALWADDEGLPLLDDEYLQVASFGLLAAMDTELDPASGEDFYLYLFDSDEGEEEE